jgi:hypothetical protein
MRDQSAEIQSVRDVHVVRLKFISVAKSNCESRRKQV